LEQFLKEDAASVVDGYIGTGQVPFGLKIDGKVVLTYDQVLQSRRVSTDLFDLTGHPSMSFLDECVTGSSQQAVADIFLAVVVETPVGTHTFEVFDDTGTTTATIYVTISSADSDPLDHPYARSLQQMYVAYYGRPGDPGGVSYWAGRMGEVGGNWIPDLVNAFGTSAEYTERFGALEPAALIDNLYRQLYNRDADPLGRAFYIDLLNASNLSGYNPALRRSTLAQIALDIANGTAGGDVLTLANKLDVATDFTRQLQITAHAYEAQDIPLVSRLIATVTGVRQTVDIATGYVDDFMNGIADGQWQVGTDILPGTYANLHDGDCAWARLSGFGGTPADVITDQSWSEPGAVIVTIDPTDAGFRSEHCGTWIADGMPLAASPTAPHGSGVYRVGRDLQAGTWQADNLAGTCTWELLYGFSGDETEVIEGGAEEVPGPVRVTVEASDMGFSASGCGTWTLQPGN
jgi:hypothetical protein